MTFVMLTSESDLGVLVNSSRVIYGVQFSERVVRLTLDDGTNDRDAIRVIGQLPDVMATLNAATPQLHPSMLMPPPAPWAPKPAPAPETEATRD